MSISRASGAIRMITALQIATASFAVPKSVMNTIVGRSAPVIFSALSSAALVPHPAQARATATNTTPNRDRCEVNNFFRPYECTTPPIPNPIRLTPPGIRARQRSKQKTVRQRRRIIADGRSVSKLEAALRSRSDRDALASFILLIPLLSPIMMSYSRSVALWCNG